MRDGILTGDLAVLVEQEHCRRVVNFEESLEAIAKRLAKKMHDASGR